MASAASVEADFDGDGRSDLAVGVRYEEIEGDYGAGAVNVIYGSPDGLTPTGDQVLSQDTTGIRGTAERLDQFGSALATGDFNGDGRGDLAVGVGGEDVDGVTDAGAVNVIYGSASGLTVSGDQVFTQDTTGIRGTAEPGDHFGYALETGDLDDDGRADLAVGAHLEDIDGVTDAGAVNVIYGSAGGLTVSGDQVFSQNTTGIRGTAEIDDHFGFALATGDLDGDGRADLAVGVHTEDIDGAHSAGAVNVIYGSADGLTVSGDQVISQNTTGIEGIAEIHDAFGGALATGDFDGDGRADLAVGVPREDDPLGSSSYGGAVDVIYGSFGGLTVSGDQVFSLSTTGIEADSLYGYALAAGRFDGDAREDLAVGVPEGEEPFFGNGAVN